ncbi:MAG: hypothetical protein ACK4EY_09260 [Flavipsychrobacter sp.]
MKKMRLAATAGLLAFLAVSCSKDKNDTTPNNPNPNNPTPSNVIDEAKLKSKWEMTSHYNIVYDKDSGYVRDASGVSQTYHNHGVGQWNAAYTTYLTFNSDNTFDHSNADGSDGSPILIYYMPKHGTWQLGSGNKAISLEIIPVLNKTTITYDVVEFKDSYIHLTYTDSTTWDDVKDVHHLEFKK